MQKEAVTHFAMPRVTYAQRLFYSHEFAEDFHADVNNEVIHIIKGRIKLRFQSGLEYVGTTNDTLFIPHGIYHKDIFES